MLRFWRNPEFLRHRRAELRAGRAVAVVVVVLVICVLVGLACWASRQADLERARQAAAELKGVWEARLPQWERQNGIEFWRLFYRSLMLMQAGVLTFWSLLSCAQAVSGERERKTWDFQLTTALKPAELLMGKLLGEPVLAYFIVLCCVPVAMIAGVAGRISFLHILCAYLLMVASALFLGLGGLWLSSLFESKSRGIGLISALALYAMLAASYGLFGSSLPGLAGFSPLAALLPLVGIEDSPTSAKRAMIFGDPVPWVLMSLLLYLTAGAWLALMLTRNLKKDYREIRILNRWQAVGCAAYLNFVVFALFNPNASPMMNTRDFVSFIVAINAAILFAMGLATLTPQERLQVWWRKRAVGQASWFSEDGPSWPWLALSAVVAYALLVWGLYAWGRVFQFEARPLIYGAVELGVILVFVTRDILFLQWCKLTRLRAPLLKGVLYLGLYYTSAGVLAIVLATQSGRAAQRAINLLTPAGIFDDQAYGSLFAGSLFAGAGLQLVVVWILLVMIHRRLRRPAMVAPLAADAATPLAAQT
jgi:ABC-type transport system involved in multi-copper enzyme maturation permease subunit